uniref:Uncharacterized protein n=1 Tax=Lates calcarifer TaxID=8187 RepID=A0A4W6G7J9_LATCA
MRRCEGLSLPLTRQILDILQGFPPYMHNAHYELLLGEHVLEVSAASATLLYRRLCVCGVTESFILSFKLYVLHYKILCQFLLKSR